MELSSSDDEQWEEVGVEENPLRPFSSVETLDSNDSLEASNASTSAEDQPSKMGNITVNLPKRKKRSGITKKQRIIQQNLHKVHLTCLCCHAIRVNRDIIDDELIQSVLLSLVPRYITDHLSQKSKQVKRIKSIPKKFHFIIAEIIKWWRGFFATSDVSITPELEISRDTLFHQIENRKANSEYEYNVIFAALCRCLNLEARFVYLFNPIPFKKSVATARHASLRKKRDSLPDKRRKISTCSAVSDSVKYFVENSTDEKVPSSCEEQASLNFSKSDPISINDPFIAWIEIFLPSEENWITVDPCSGICDPQELIDKLSKSKLNFYPSYVIAYEQLTDHAADLTRKYLDVSKIDVFSYLKKYKMVSWWFSFLDMLHQIGISKSSRYPSSREKEESAMTDRFKVAKFPSTISAFNNHPIYVLERHLKKYEIIYPKGPENAVGQIRGETIYPRIDVHILHTSDKWLSQEGRVISKGENPIKYVKSRSASMKSKREIKFLDDEPDDDVEGQDVQAPEPSNNEQENNIEGKVGLYGRWQTEIYKPEPIVNGIIPKNRYNNIDLFKPSMLPPGAAHVTEDELQAYLIENLENGLSCDFDLLAKLNPPSLKTIAKSMSIDFADAVVGFEIHGGRSVPSIDGLVIARENEIAFKQKYMQIMVEEVKQAQKKQNEELDQAEHIRKKDKEIKQRIKDRYGDS